MSGEPNAFNRGTIDTFGQKFGVSIPKDERELGRAIRGRSGKSGYKARTQYRKPTKVIIDEPVSAPIDVRLVMAAVNKLTGVLRDMESRMRPPKQDIRAIKYSIAWLEKFLAP
jgi:hypothetical protein